MFPPRISQHDEPKRGQEQHDIGTIPDGMQKYLEGLK